MKKWCLRILSAFLTFTLGLFATALERIAFAPSQIPPVSHGANIQAQFPSPQMTEEVQPEDAQTTDEVEEVMQPHLVSISPDEIKRIIDNDELPPCTRGGYSGYSNYGPLWKELNLKISDEGMAFPANCSSLAKAYLYPMELDGRAGNEILLKLDFGVPEATLYLLFKHSGHLSEAGWNFLGSIPFYYGAPFIPPSHKVVTDGRHSWLVIDYNTGHGSGFGMYAEDWYEVSDKGVVNVLSFQNSLYLGYGNLTIDSDTTLLKCENNNGMSTVVLQTSIAYGSYDTPHDAEPLSLWKSKWQTTYVKIPGMRKFTLDTLRSAAAEEFSPLGEDGNRLSKDFLKYNYVALAKIAAKGNEKQKEWIEAFLDAREESAEKQSLLKVLEENNRK